MELEVGRTAGFCDGVNLCIKRLNEAIDNNDKVYCLGEVVHNKDVVSDFENNRNRACGNTWNISITDLYCPFCPCILSRKCKMRWNSRFLMWNSENHMAISFD